MTNIAKLIKDMRLKSKYSQQAVSNGLGIIRTTYNNYERGVVAPTFEFLWNLAKFYEIPVDKFSIDYKSSNIVNWQSNIEKLIDHTRTYFLKENNILISDDSLIEVLSDIVSYLEEHTHGKNGFNKF